MSAVVLATVLLSAGWAVPGATAAPATVPQFLLVGGTASGNVAVMSMQPDGALRKVDGSPFPVGAGVLSLAVAPHGRTVYVTQAGARKVTGYRIDDQGALHPIPGADVATDGVPVTSVLSPDGSLLFVAVGGLPGHISSYSVAASGALTPTASTAVAGTSAIPMVTVDPNGRYLRFVSAADGSISSFAIGPGGALTALGSPVPGGVLPVNPGTTPDGRFIYVSNEQGSNVSGYSIGPDGRMTSTPGSPYSTGGMPHGAEITGDGRRLYIPEVSGGRVSGFSIGADGALTPLPGSPYPAPPGTGPGRVLLSDDERHLYAADVLTTTVTSKVHTFDVRPDGSLTPSVLPSVDTGTVVADGPVLVKTP